MNVAATITDDLTTWANSGLMWLTGTPDKRFGPPGSLMAHAEDLGRRLAGIDVAALLTDRAAIAGLSGRGTVSCGGACHLLRTLDGWIAVSLPRPDDEALVPAWLEVPVETDRLWSTVEHEVAGRATAEILERATLLQMAVTALGEQHRDDTAEGTHPVRRIPIRRDTKIPSHRRGSPSAPLVVDLSGLWAGPLCGHLLQTLGARVLKVESTRRPDGARFGPRPFFDMLNADKRCVALDFGSETGLLHDLVMHADIVIDSSRPRATAQLGIDPATSIASGGPRIWISITAHGRDADRIGFGDDAAVAGGLVVSDDDEPMFCGDAIADPLSGVTAAAECLEALDDGFDGILDVSMSAVAASCAGPSMALPHGTQAVAPRPRPPTGHAHELGQDTDAVLSELGIRR